MQKILDMKLMLSIIGFISLNLSFAQSFEGHWLGKLSIGGVKLKVVMHFEKNGDKWEGTMDSPDQSAFDIPISRIEVVNQDSLIIGVMQAMLLYNGKLTHPDTIVGTVLQGGQKVPLVMGRTTLESLTVKRPQTPKAPFSYNAEEVEFVNKKADITLAGTLTYPKEGENFPAVILVSGSGPQDRDETIMQHHPFWVIADYLSSRGIAVLRFDDRGVGKSKGNFASATTFDFANDVEAALDYLMKDKRIDKKNIGIVGHSEGGLIAPIVASRNKSLNHIVLLAGPGVRGDSIIGMQSRLIMKADGYSEEEIASDMKLIDHVLKIIASDMEIPAIKDSVSSYLTKEINAIPDSLLPEGTTKQMLLMQSIPRYKNDWMINFIRLDPIPYLQKLRCDVFAVNGGKDLQVPPNENIEAIKSALEESKSKSFETKIYPNLNHLFQNCDTGSPTEYGDIEESFSPEVLEDLHNWIINR